MVMKKRILPSLTENLPFSVRNISKYVMENVGESKWLRQKNLAQIHMLCLTHAWIKLETGEYQQFRLLLKS